MAHMTRRRFLAGTLAACTAPSLVQAGAALAASAPLSLGARAARAGLTFGTAIHDEILTDADYRALVREQARILTTESAFKFDWLRPHSPTPDFTRADALLAFAREAGLPIRAHTLIWNDWPPAWLARLSAAELRRTFDWHIDQVMTRYAGRLHSWDVVNEPFWPGNWGGWRTGPWLDAFGPAYVTRAFTRAHAADPTARLVLNEAFAEYDDAHGRSVRRALLRLVDEMQQGGIPLHAIGLQAHVRPNLPFSAAAFEDFLHDLATRGLPIWLTEIDVDDRFFPADIPTRDALVAQHLASMLAPALRVPAVDTLIFWQLSDRHTWLRNVPGSAGSDPTRLARALPFDEDLAPKPEFMGALTGAIDSRGV